MTNKSKANLIIDYFDEILPNAGCALNYTKDYEFLIAVMLSAQTTDAKVNKVTEILFNKYRDLKSLSTAKYDDVFSIIKPLGMASKKTQNILDIAGIMIKKYDFRVVNNKEELMKLSGVGNKTAEVVLVELFHEPNFPVDTHVHRIAKRLNITNDNDDVVVCEEKLKRYFPKDKWIKLHHQFIHFGRSKCTAKNPKCESCALKDICKN